MAPLGKKEKLARITRFARPLRGDGGACAGASGETEVSLDPAASAPAIKQNL